MASNTDIIIIAMATMTSIKRNCNEIILPQPKSHPYVGLDIFKLFFALCVVAIHTYAVEGLPESVSYWIKQAIFRLAVPFFFAVSGFLLGEKIHEQNKDLPTVIGKYIKRLLPLLLCVETANGLLELLLRHLSSETGLGDLIVLFVKHLIFYPYGAMWYVQACIIGLLMLYPFLKREKLNLALGIGALLYGWALLCNNYYFVAQASGFTRYVNSYMSAFLSARNGVFVGFFYMAIGIKTYEWHQKDFEAGMLAGAGVVSLALYLTEIYLLRGHSFLENRELYITHILFTPMLVLCVLRMKTPIDGAVSAIMRKLSGWIYFSHRLIYVIGRILCFLMIGIEPTGIRVFVAVTVISVLTFAAAKGIRSGLR